MKTGSSPNGGFFQAIGLLVLEREFFQDNSFTIKKSTPVYSFAILDKSLEPIRSSLQIPGVHSLQRLLNLAFFSKMNNLFELFQGGTNNLILNPIQMTHAKTGCWL